MMNSVDNYVQYLRSVVPYNNFKRLGHTFRTDEKLYFYDSGTGKVFQCQEEEYEVFKCLTENGTAESIKELSMDKQLLLSTLDTIKQIIEQENILKMPVYEKFDLSEKETIKELVDGSLRQLTLEVTQSCNLRCRYCIYHTANEGFRDFSVSHMNWETAKNAIDYAYAHSGDKLAITFYGGEPLINYDLIKQSIDYSEQIKDQNKEVTYSFTSNLTLMTKEMAEYFASIGNCGIMGSIDGPQAIHDEFRITADKKGSFTQAIQGLKYLVEAYKEAAKDNISINAVLTPPYSEEKFDMVNTFFKELSWLPDDVQVRCSYQDPETYESTFPDGVPEIYAKQDGAKQDDYSIRSWAVKHVIDGSETVVHRTILEDTLIKIQHRIIANQPISVMRRNACCIPAQRRLYITADGDLKVCERVGESPYFGNVNKGIDFELLYKFYIQDYQEKMAGSCSDCWCVHLCSMCYSNYCTSKEIDFQKKMASCTGERKYIKGLLADYHKIQEKRSKWLLSLNEMKPV